MTLEFEKLGAELDRMAQTAVNRRQQAEAWIDEALATLHAHALSWERLETALEKAIEKTDAKFFRAARPLDQIEPMNAAVPPPACPAEATLVAADGSQILPDRHGAFLYYVINVGVFLYYHGQGRSPEAFTRPRLDYPHEELLGDSAADEREDTFMVAASALGIRRDLAEIGTLADTAWERRHEARPLLALLDQRLLYWPVGSRGATESNQAIDGWLKGMTKVRDSGGLLAGYIDRPGKSSVVTLLQTLDMDRPGFDLSALGRRNPWQGPTDVDLFSRVLRPGQRSKVFVEVSDHNRRFAEQEPPNEVCFFYLNPGRAGKQVARVDMPRWVAEDAEAVAAVHSLLYDQCQLLGDYPYALTRADELAVVGRRDQEELEYRMALKMQAAGVVDGAVTAKQASKEAARGGRTRHGV